MLLVLKFVLRQTERPTNPDTDFKMVHGQTIKIRSTHLIERLYTIYVKLEINPYELTGLNAKDYSHQITFSKSIMPGCFCYFQIVTGMSSDKLAG